MRLVPSLLLLICLNRIKSVRFVQAFCLLAIGGASGPSEAASGHLLIGTGHFNAAVGAVACTATQ